MIATRATTLPHLLAVVVLAAAALPSQALEPTQLFEKVSPSVWIVRALDASERPFGQGSAVVIGPGTLITNCHVLAKAASVQVRRDNVTFEAKLEHADAGRDLCQLKVSRFDAPAVEIAQMSALKVGQRVYAIGNPRAMEATLSEGLISGLRTVFDNPHLNVSSEVIQTTAPISPGSSGGGLFDQDGRLIGITTLIRRDAQNINIALPADWIAEVPARAQAALAKRNAPQQSAAAGAGAVPPGYPAPGTVWVYGFTERLFSRRRIDVTVRVLRVDDNIVEESVVASAGGQGARRVVDARASRFIEYPLGGDAALIELAPYLLAGNDGNPPLHIAGMSVYPTGGPGLAGWAYKTRVHDWEQVTVPAGTFRALRIDISGERNRQVFTGVGSFTGQFRISAWYAPDAKRLVRLEHKAWSGAISGTGRQIGEEVLELLKYSPPP
jgi:hypothetical protein